MSAEVKHNIEKQRFELGTEGGLAVCEYREQDGLWFITHTGVPEQMQGRGIAAILVQEVLREARSSGRKVRPLCSYVAAYIARHPGYSDLVA